MALADRVSGPKNVEQVLLNLGKDLSEVMAVFQGSRHNVSPSTYLFILCDKKVNIYFTLLRDWLLQVNPKPQGLDYLFILFY